MLNKVKKIIHSEEFKLRIALSLVLGLGFFGILYTIDVFTSFEPILPLMCGILITTFFDMFITKFFIKEKI